MLSTAIQAPKGRRSRDAERSRVNFDEIGNLPNLEKVYTDIETNASPIVAIRFTYDNSVAVADDKEEGEEMKKNRRGGILFAYIDYTHEDGDGDDDGNTTQNREMRLNAPVASAFVQNVTSSYDSNRYSEGAPMEIGRQCLLVTGYVGDCRAVAHKAVMIHYNHTNEFDGPASGKYLSEKLSQFLTIKSMGNADSIMRVHAFIASAISPHKLSLYSIDAGGNSVEVYAGMSGRNMKRGMKILEEEYDAFNTTLKDAKLIAERMIAAPTDRSLHDDLKQLDVEQKQKTQMERVCNELNEEEGGNKVDLEPVKVKVNFTVLYDYYNR